MTIFERGNVVRVPFPYTDRATRQHRPALVISAGRIGEEGALLWVVMITSAENRRWDDDIDFGEHFAAVGLPAPSVIRPCKIATIEARDATILGRISPETMSAVDAALRRCLGR